jgi:hypothetical protein
MGGLRGQRSAQAPYPIGCASLISGSFQLVGRAGSRSLGAGVLVRSLRARLSRDPVPPGVLHGSHTALWRLSHGVLHGLPARAGGVLARGPRARFSRDPVPPGILMALRRLSGGFHTVFCLDSLRASLEVPSPTPNQIVLAWPLGATDTIRGPTQAATALRAVPA